MGVLGAKQFVGIGVCIVATLLAVVILLPCGVLVADLAARALGVREVAVHDLLTGFPLARHPPWHVVSALDTRN